jgi:hypothetical protein
MQMAQSTNKVNDILGQARQGSVAAIIQVLNEQLADSGIRTRAILADGILQLLCEAPTEAQLEKTEVVSRVKTILESLAPRHIRKVNINSRLVREEQLLWYEEIMRDPENQLLWSELIKINQPHPLLRFWQDLQQPKSRSEIIVTDKKRNQLSQKYFLRGLVGGASLCLLLVLLGWVIKHRLGISWAEILPQERLSEDMQPEPTAVAPPPNQDVFAQAVRLAEQAAADGQLAQTPAEWLDLAARWQRASELMAQVPPEDENYQVAQDRVEAYQNNSNLALNQAEQLQQASTGGAPAAVEAIQ